MLKIASAIQKSQKSQKSFKETPISQPPSLLQGLLIWKKKGNFFMHLHVCIRGSMLMFMLFVR